jgi:O-antigen/teichoic acid export membrane protein
MTEFSVVARVRSSRFWRLGIEGCQIALGQGVAVAGGMVGVRALTGRLTPAQYGELALGVTIGGLVIQLSLGPLQQGAIRFFGPAHEVKELGACLGATWKLMWRTAKLVSLLAAVIVVALLLSQYRDWVGLAVGALLLALLSGYERILDALQSAGRQRAITAWHQGLFQWLRFLLAIGLIRWFGARSSLAMLGYVLATVLVLASQFGFFRRRWGPVIDAESRRPESVGLWQQRIVQYARPFAAWGAFSWLQQSSDRWALQAFSTTSDVGYYTVLFQLGYGPIILLTGVLVQFVQPIFFNQSGDGTDEQRVASARRINHRLLLGFFALTFLGTVAAQLLHRQLFAWLVAPEYRSVSWLMPWMLLSGGLFACGELAALTLMSGLRTRTLRSIKICTALIGIGLNLVGAHWLGLRGVVFASVSFSLASLAWTLWASLASLPPVKTAVAVECADT